MTDRDEALVTMASTGSCVVTIAGTGRYGLWQLRIVAGTYCYVVMWLRRRVLAAPSDDWRRVLGGMAAPRCATLTTHVCYKGRRCLCGGAVVRMHNRFG